MIDVGLKIEGRVPLKEFGISGRAARAHGRRQGRRLSRARRERAGRGRAVAREGAARGELDPARGEIQRQGAGRRRHLQPGQGRLHRRSRRRRGLPAWQPGRHPPDPRRRPADERAAALPDPEDGSPPRQHRRVAPLGAGRDARREAQRDRRPAGRGPGDRRRGQEHHRLRRLHRSRRHRRPACTSPTWPGGASIIRARSSMSAIP